jgi:PelA/Pel-15E family pectate lyase
MESRGRGKRSKKVALRLEMNSKLRRTLNLAVVLCLAAFVGGPIGWATVIGRSEAAQSLTTERISALPTAERGVWLAYLQRSERQEKLDRAALASERQGMKDIPPDPQLGFSARSTPLDRESSWYGSPEARHIADVIVSFQTPAGGWGKNMNMDGSARVRGQSFVPDNSNRLPSPNDFDAARDPSWHYVGTLDNDATTTQMHFLAKVQANVGSADGDAYRAAFLRGVRYLLAAQYPNGGWPQVWPLEGGYHDAITFNDDAVYNATELLTDISEGKPDTAFVPKELRNKAASAAASALKCILAAQFRVSGRETIWGQQVDMLTLQPVAARNYEPAALSSEESAHLLSYLMSVPQSSAQVKVAISSGISWLQAHAIYGKAVVGGRNTPEGRHLVAQQGAGPLWARFYALDTEKPIFGDRDKTLHDDMNEISLERRNGYAWFNTAPVAALSEYDSWKLSKNAKQ